MNFLLINGLGPNYIKPEYKINSVSHVRLYNNKMEYKFRSASHVNLTNYHYTLPCRGFPPDSLTHMPESANMASASHVQQSDPTTKTTDEFNIHGLHQVQQRIIIESRISYMARDKSRSVVMRILSPAPPKCSASPLSRTPHFSDLFPPLITIHFRSST